MLLCVILTLNNKQYYHFRSFFYSLGGNMNIVILWLRLNKTWYYVSVVYYLLKYSRYTDSTTLDGNHLALWNKRM